MFQPRHSAITANVSVIAARRRIASPVRTAQHLSRAELAAAINVLLEQTDPDDGSTGNHVDVCWIGKLERGEHRWPGDERRAALRQVLQVATDTDLGLYRPPRFAAEVSAQD
jgi:transcriptional regulator with XRE-family HTH domain